MRDLERAPEPAPGVLRVALVGDSFVFGEGVPLEKALPARLQADLGAKFEILNLGWPGDAVFPPHLQLIGAALFDVLEPGESEVSAAHYSRLGGFEAIVGGGAATRGARSMQVDPSI